LAVNVYEGMFILDSNRYARDPGGVPRRIDDEIKQLGGEVLVSRLWAEQKLAYTIKGQGKGTYWLTYFRLDSDRLAELNHQTNLNNSVLRSLVIVIDPRLVGTMVAHASPGVKSDTSTEAGEKKEEETASKDEKKSDEKKSDVAEPAAADS
jgi:small subunit ribosomal protein S6